MHRSISKALFLLAWIPMGIPRSTANMERALAIGADTCKMIILKNTGIDPEDAPLISSQNKITVRMARAFRFSSVSYVLKLQSILEKNERDRCVERVKKFNEALVRYLDRRFTLLLDQGKLESFRSEMKTLISPFLFSQRIGVSTLWKEQQNRYLKIIAARLLIQLEGTPWASYVEIPFTLEALDEDWEEKLTPLHREDDPAIVDLETHSMVFHALSYTPEEISLYLFHELSHLADPMVDSKDRYLNEVYSWDQTLHYITFLKSRNLSVPESFLEIVQSINDIGLRTWVCGLPAFFGIEPRCDELSRSPWIQPD